MSDQEQAQDFFRVGGSLNPNVPSYVVRAADEELPGLVLAGHFCYVLSARQMGKSSLMIRAAGRLQTAGIRVAMLDLGGIGTEDNIEAWYLSLISQIHERLKVSTDYQSWWEARAGLSPVQRFSDYLRQVVLNEISGQVAIFIDEIDTTLQLSFSDDFFAAIRAVYNARASDAEYERLTFVLLGVAMPGDLIEDRTRTPFNIGQGVALQEFSSEEGTVLRDGLESAYPGEGNVVFTRIYHWTGGHPYLTQKLCAAAVQSSNGLWSEERVDALVEENFFAEEASRKELNLQFIRDRIQTDANSPALLQVYRQVWQGEEVSDEERSVVKSRLKLYGLVRATPAGTLAVRNRIYERVFDLEWIRESIQLDTKGFFRVGGTLGPDAPSYVVRAADEELPRLVLAGHFCYILSTRQMGKSSLMVRTAGRLQTAGIRVAMIELSGIGTGDNVEAWYLSLISQIHGRLKLSTDYQAWWEAHSKLSPVQRFSDYLRQVLLEEVPGRVVIFIDEIDTTLKLAFSDDFFAAIRAVYNARASDAEYGRLTFVLSGVARPADLIEDRTRTPFNIGQGVTLQEFSLEEGAVLHQGLEASYPEEGESIFARIYHWTGGHPYLTQKLCAAAVQSDDGPWDEGRVDMLVLKSFFTKEASRKESNLQFIRDRVQASPDSRQLLRLYRQVRAGKEIQDEERSAKKSRLKLYGLVRATPQGTLAVRNRIYERVFDLDWVKEAMPSDLTRWVPAASLVVALVALALAGYFYIRAQRQTAQFYAEQFRTSTSSDVRVTSLAGLLGVPGYEDSARSLYYEELTLAEQVAMFAVSDPLGLQQELITIVKVLYTEIDNTPSHSLVLEAMAAPLQELDSPEARNLATEIEQWLRGRELDESSRYQEAIDSYSIAIGLNPRNPAVYSDRASTQAAAGRFDVALSDFVRVIELDENRAQRVVDAITANTSLRDHLLAQPRNYSALAAYFPTPTATPTPTPIPTFTVTFTPTASPIPTATPTPSLTPSLTPTSSRTPSATPTLETPTLTPRPANTLAPTRTPTKLPTTTPAMELLADLQFDFSDGQGQKGWEYLFSEGRDSFIWKQMSFDGICWRSPFSEPIRICIDHGSPGVDGDIAWHYRAEASGPLIFRISARKVQSEGDDIRIRMYRHVYLLHTWYLAAADTTGLTKQVEIDANGGESFFFTMQVSSTHRAFKYDPTLFSVQVYEVK